MNRHSKIMEYLMRMHDYKTLKGFLIGSACCAALLVAPAEANEENEEQQSQQSSENPQNNASADEVDTIVVSTARYRQEASKDVPIGSTVFNASAIADARITQVGDFLALTPNVTFVPEADFGGSFVTIRGVAQVRNVESPVAVVLDGIPQIHPSQFTQELFDISSIEVLRGPQGALYGRNASGGAIIINTVMPTNEYEGNTGLRVGKNNELQVQGSISGPIVEDKLFFRVGARYLKRDGYHKSLAIDEFVDPAKDISLRSTLRYVDENLTAQLNVNLTRFEGGANNFVYQGILFDPATPGEYNLLPGFFDPPVDFNTTDPRIDADNTDVPYTQNNVGFTDRDVNEISLKVDYDLGGMALTSISAYSAFTAHQTQDGFPYTNSGSPNETGAASYLDVSAFNQEFRLASTENEYFHWMVGTSYLKTDRFISLTQNMDLGRGIPRVERTPPGPDSIGPNESFVADDNKNTAFSFFANVAIDLTDDLEASFAYRYDEDRRTQTVSDFQTDANAGAVNQVTFSQGQPKASLRYKATENLSLYTSWGKGFRSGQFNQAGLFQRTLDVGMPGIPDVLDKEVTETIEVGFKSVFSGGLIQLNGALFQTNVDGFYYFAFIPQTGDDALINIDDVRLRGGEIELIARPTDGLQFHVSYGFTDSVIQLYNADPSALGNKAPYVAKNTFNIGGQYRADLTEDVGLFMRADYERRGEQFWDPENTSSRSPVDLLTLRLGIEATDGSWSLISTVNNALDEKYNSEYVGGQFPGIAHRALPRVYSLDFNYKF